MALRKSFYRPKRRPSGLTLRFVHAQKGRLADATRVMFSFWCLCARSFENY